MRFAGALRGVSLAADASPLMGGEARSGCARWLPLGRHRCVFALAARSARRSHRLLHCPLRSLRRPRTKRATGTFRRLPASRAGRRTHRSPMSLEHGLRSRRLNRAHGPPTSAQRVESLRPVDARCTSLLTRQTLGALAAMILPRGACSPGFRAPSARGSRLRRPRGCGPPSADRSPRTGRDARVPEPERPFRRKCFASGPSPGMSLSSAVPPPPCRAPWRCPAWRNRGQGGCRPP